MDGQGLDSERYVTGQIKSVVGILSVILLVKCLVLWLLCQTLSYFRVLKDWRTLTHLPRVVFLRLRSDHRWRTVRKATSRGGRKQCKTSPRGVWGGTRRGIRCRKVVKKRWPFPRSLCSQNKRNRLGKVGTPTSAWVFTCTEVHEGPVSPAIG